MKILNNIFDIQNDTYYLMIDALGQPSVYRIHDNTEVKPYLDKTGYLRIRLFNNQHITHSYAIHRIYLASVEKVVENKIYVNHKNGNKQDNHINNLEWVTASENIQHYHTYLKNDTIILINDKYKVVAQFNSLDELSKCTLLKKKTILQARKQKTKIFGLLIFTEEEYKNTSLEELEVYFSKTSTKPIVCYGKIYKSIRAAHRSTGHSEAYIKKQLLSDNSDFIYYSLDTIEDVQRLSRSWE